MNIFKLFGLALCCVFVIFGVAIGQGEQSQQATSPEDLESLKKAVQGICPVSGEELGSMGKPVKVKVGEQVVLLCCKACQKKKINGKHWATIEKRFAAAQATCPIMEKPVDASMDSTVVQGQKVFVCCPPCTEKIESDPDAAIAKVAESYKKFVAAERKSKSEQLHVKAQVICPVSGEALGVKGKPFKVKVGKSEHAYLCCKDCAGKKIDAKHWKTVQDNLAKAQGVCPIMNKPVDSSMEFTVVKGRKIFVCCPPCIEKIDAEPDAMVAKLDAQISENKSIQR